MELKGFKEKNVAELEVKIEDLRGKLNELMSNKDAYDYKDILNVSVELDKLIYNYYLLINNGNKKKSTK